MGEPSSLTAAQKKLLQESARPSVSSARVCAEDKTAELGLRVKEHGVVYFELNPSKLQPDRGYAYDRVMQYSGGGAE